jgi:hypothetical protein
MKIKRLRTSYAGSLMVVVVCDKECVVTLRRVGTLIVLKPEP